MAEMFFFLKTLVKLPMVAMGSTADGIAARLVSLSCADSSSLTELLLLILEVLHDELGTSECCGVLRRTVVDLQSRPR